MLVLLGAVVVFGGGRRLLQAYRARGSVALLEGNDASPEAIEAAAQHGRAGLYDLFRLMAEARGDSARRAAGRALARLWKNDDLITEEEKALVQRGFQATWKARRRYPRGLEAEVPFTVEFGVPFLREADGEVGPTNLEWSSRILGSGRASLEKPGPWQSGQGRAGFLLIPADFPTNGPHRLVLDVRARTVGLTSSWELSLPQVPFSFEFDPRLAVDSLLASPDAERAALFARRVRLVPSPEGAEGPHFLDLGSGMALRNPPRLEVETPLPCDLAGMLFLEVEGSEARLPAGPIVLGGQGEGDPIAAETRQFALNPPTTAPSVILQRPGRVRVRGAIVPDPQLGWGEPSIRSVWPETIVTNWCEVEVVRS